MGKVKQPYYSLYYPKCAEEYLSLLKEGKTYALNEDYYESIKEELMEIDDYLPEALTMFMDEEFVRQKKYNKYRAAYFEVCLQDEEIQEAGGHMDDLFLRLWIEKYPQYKDLIIIEPKRTPEEWEEIIEDLKRFSLEIGLPIK